FEMINAFALVTVSFGVSFQVGLLGSCSMSFPASGAALAYIEIDIVASFTPASGLLAVDGRLNPASYIYGGFIHLSGGFAFYIWFGATQHTGEDDHKGQFVVSIGGYHPAFDKPLYYPTVPRLAMSAGLGPLQITGQAYFALTPAMMMAGISMTATWSSGPIKAWFSAGVDFLIAWAPFHYEASAYVTIGCSVNLGLFTLNVHVGAALAIWGPEFGGKATVDLDVVSFTISFGAPPSTPPPINWDTFRASFLPPDTTPKQQPQLRAMTRRTARAAVRAPDPLVTVNVIKATVAKGLLGTYDGDNWLIDPDHFVIDTNSSIPSNIGQWTITGGVDTISPNVSSYGKVDADGLFLDLPPSTFSPQQVWNPNLDIGPMDQKGVKSYHTITLLRVDSNTLVTGLSVMPILLNSNAALWTAKNDQKTANDPPLTNSTLVGFEITPIPQHPDQVSNVPLLALLFDPGSSTGFSYQTATVDPNFTVQATTDAQGDLTIAISGAHSESIVNTGNELAALVDPWVAGQRTSLLTDLAASFDTYAPADVSLTMMAQKALMNWPTTELLGADS
ncbi:MAG TPA: DUF6603 domain-containing protein, partial [Bryobacteraceae bacterium]|nr:DUF6603 domain-containing protein [Bryobacteraceae bacterium]